MTAPRIHTSFWQKPIPTDKFDWAAHYDDYEGGDGYDEPAGPVGYGATEAEAIADLTENHPREEVPSPANFEETFGCPGCICRMSPVHSASIDPPEPVRNRHCPHHGTAPDPDDARDRAIEDEIMERRR